MTVQRYGADPMAGPPERPAVPGELAAQSASAAAGAYGHMSLREAQILFDEVKRRGFLTTQGDVQELPFDEVEDNCSERAHHMALQLTTAGVPCKRIFAVSSAGPFGQGLMVDSEHANGGTPEAPQMIAWHFHTAISVQVAHGAGAGSTEMVFDPAIAPNGPITTEQWLAAMHVEQGDVMRLGEGYQQVLSRLQSMGDVARDPDGYPSHAPSVFTLEPQAYYQPRVHPQTHEPVSPEQGPPTFTMDDAHQAFLAKRPELEYSAMRSGWRKMWN